MATLTVYPDPNVETTTVDGHVSRAAVDETFSTIRSGAGTAVQDDQAFLLSYIRASNVSNQYGSLYRSFILFDTSSLTAGATISSVVLSVVGQLKDSGLGSPNLHVAGATTASNTALATGDFANRGTTSFGNVTYASFSTSGYNDITLDANGIANVSKTGVSKFSLQLSWDILNSFTGSWSSFATAYFQMLGAETSGTTSDPKLVVTYETSVFTSKVMII